MADDVERVASIDAGLPSSRDEWPASVLDSCAEFSMGDLIEKPPFFYYATPQLAVWDATKDYVVGSDGSEIVDASEYAPPFAMIVTQTCDIGEIDADIPARPWIQVSPVFDLTHIDGGTRKLLRQGKGPLHLLHLPALPAQWPGFWVADLRIEFPLEKSVLAGREPISGFSGELEQREVGRRPAYLRGRPAWSGAVVEGVQRGLVTALKNLRASDASLYAQVLNAIDSIGARTDDMLNPHSLQLCAFESSPLDAAGRAWWFQVCDKLYEAPELSGMAFQAPLIRSCSVCSIAEWREFEPVPLTRFSPF